MKRLKKNYIKALIALCTIFTVALPLIADVMAVLTVLCIEAVSICAKAGVAIASMYAAVALDNPHMPSKLEMEMRRDPVIQHVVNHQKTIAVKNNIAVISTDSPARTMHNLAAAQKNLVQSIPNQVLADVAIPLAHVTEAVRSQELKARSDKY